MNWYPYISIVIPAYNEEKRIGVFLDSITAYFRKRRVPYEVVVVDDGSTDDTKKVVGRYALTYPCIRLVSYRENQGKGYAVNFGMEQARGEYRLFADADGSVAIEHLDTFFAYMKQGYDVVIGSIEVPGTHVTEHNVFYRRVLGSLSKVLIRFVAVPGIYDTQRGFKLFSRAAARDIFPCQTIKRFGFDIELLVIAREHALSIKEVPVEWINPAGSKVTLRSYPNTFVELLEIKVKQLLGRYQPGQRTWFLLPDRVT